jgi:hypothetical protein
MSREKRSSTTARRPSNWSLLTCSSFIGILLPGLVEHVMGIMGMKMPAREIPELAKTE